MSAVVTERSLDEILDLKEPERTNVLTEWMEGSDDPVLLKANKAPWKVDHDGKEWNISPKGRTVGRRDAVYLLYKFGKNGIYRHKDRATGLTKNVIFQIQARDDESTKYWDKRGYPEIVDNFIYHAVKEQAEADAA
jgi:hypothetical protein